MQSLSSEFLGVFLILAGYIIGLGAVTVIDLHGFFAQKSSYWTEATLRTHKITKPLIWVGILLLVFGSFLFYDLDSKIFFSQSVIFFVLVLNGIFLSLKISPFLLKREKEGRASEILPTNWQDKIFISFMISVSFWWGSVFLFVSYLIDLIN